MSTTLMIIGIIVLLLGLLGSVILALMFSTGSGLGFSVFLIGALFSTIFGVLLMGFGKVISLLEEIRDNTRDSALKNSASKPADSAYAKSKSFSNAANISTPQSTILGSNVDYSSSENLAKALEYASTLYPPELIRQELEKIENDDNSSLIENILNTPDDKIMQRCVTEARKLRR